MPRATELALEFGATDVIEERGDEGAARIKQLTNGLGAHSVIEAVGTREFFCRCPLSRQAITSTGKANSAKQYRAARLVRRIDGRAT